MLFSTTLSQEDLYQVSNDPYALTHKFENLGRRGRPTVAYFEVTYRCNARCDYCYLGALRDTVQDSDTKSIFAILDKLANSGILSMAITGGEPFLRTDILEILDHCRKCGFFTTGILTNGTILTHTHLDYLAKHAKELSLTVSMTAFSSDPNINDRIFGIPNALKAILFNAEWLKEHNIPVVIKIPALKETLSSIAKSILFFKSKNFETMPSYTKIITNENRIALESSIESDFIQQYLRSIGSTDQDSLIRNYRNKKNSKPTAGSCVGLFTSIGIGPCGDLRPCLTMYPNFSDVNLHNFPDLKSAIEASTHCQTIRALTSDSFATCSSCAEAEKCEICPALNYNESQSFTIPSRQRCLYIKSLRAEATKK